MVRMRAKWGYAALRTQVRLPGLRPAGPLGLEEEGFVSQMMATWDSVPAVQTLTWKVEYCNIESVSSSIIQGQHGSKVLMLLAHSGAPGPSSCASLPSPAIGSPANSLHLRMSSGAGIAAQSDVALSPIHLPALSPRRQLLTNGKPQFPATQGRGLAASLTVKPKQQEFGDPFSPNPEKDEETGLYLQHFFTLHIAKEWQNQDPSLSLGSRVNTFSY
ncbi:hypothetical protein ACRRTK_011669 [Alexandromys fortis]